MITLLVVLGSFACSASGQEDAGAPQSEPYQVVENWWKPPHGRYQHVAGVSAVSPDRVFVTSTHELPTAVTSSPVMVPREALSPDRHRHFLLVFDANGNVVEEWTQWSSLFQVPHKVRINPYDPEKHVWIVDKGTHQVFKFTYDGKKLVMTLGEKSVRKADETHFSVPSDIGFLPDGSFFVVEEGEDAEPSAVPFNSRVIRFDKNGKFVRAWETPAKAGGEFGLAHGIAIDNNRRLYITEEDNGRRTGSNTGRVLVFDENGKYLNEWANLVDPVDVLITKDQTAWVLSGNGNKLLKYDLNGKLLYQWGTAGTLQGQLSRPHQISVDSAGNLYLTDSDNDRLQKFSPRKGADRGQLIGTLQ